jgi:import receptor subunit TOM70
VSVNETKPFVSNGHRHVFSFGLRTPPMNVLPIVNKGLALYQWKQDIGAAERCCNEALRIDPECEAAVATLAQLFLQQSKIERAVEMFIRQTELARSEPELINALTYQYVSLSFIPSTNRGHIWLMVE